MGYLTDEQLLEVHRANREDWNAKLTPNEKARLGLLLEKQAPPPPPPSPPLSFGQEYAQLPGEVLKAIQPGLGAAGYTPDVFRRATEQGIEMVKGLRQAGKGKPKLSLAEKAKLGAMLMGKVAMEGGPTQVMAKQPVESLAQTIAAPTTRLREDPFGFLSDLFTVATAPAAMSGLAGGPVSSAMKAGMAVGPEAEALSSINTFGNGIKNSIDAARGGSMVGTRPQFWRMLFHTDEGLGAALTSHVAAGDELTVVSTTLKQQLRQASKDPVVRSAFGKSLVQDQLDALDRPGAVTFTPEEAAAVKSDGFRRLDEAWRKQVQPKIESYAEASGIKSRRNTASGRYVRLQVEQPEATTGGSRGLPTYGKRTAGSAQPATGKAEAYVTDLDKLVDSTLKDRIVRARNNEMLEAVKAREVPPDPETGEVPATTTWGGKEVPVRYVPVRQGPTIVQEGGKEVTVSSKIPVPEPVAQAYNYALNAKNRDLHPDLGPFINKVNQVGLSLYLATPAEAIAHGVGVVGALERAPGIGGSLVKYTGPIGRQLASIARAVDLSGPDFANDVMDLARFGAVRSSQFAGQQHTGLTALIEKIPVYGKATKALRGGMFGAPETGAKGFSGFETRARVAFYRYLRDSDPTLSKARAAAIVNNELGTYVQGLEPSMVRVLRQIPLVGDPFAAAGVALGKGGVKNFAAMGARGIDAERFFNVYVSTVLTSMALNKALNGSWFPGPGQKPGDIRIYKGDNVTVDVPMRLWAPGISRGLGQFGIRSLIEDVMRNEEDPRKYADDLIIGTLNTAAHRMGKLGQAGLALAPGGPAPHLTPSGELMRLNPDSTESRVLHEILSIARPAGTFTDLTSTEPTRESSVDSPMLRYTIRGLPLMGLNLRVGAPERELAGAPIRSENAQIAEWARVIAARSTAIVDPNARRAWVRNKIQERYGDDSSKAKLARQTVNRYFKSRRKSVSRSLHKAEERGMPVPPSPSPEP